MPNQIAVVTGAYGGLGSELCRQLAASGVGLVLVDRNAEKSKRFADQLNKRQEGIVKATYAVDLADHQDIKRLTGTLLSAFPSIDFLFNNAGVLTETLQFSRHGNELHFEVNTLAPLQLIDQLRPALKAAGRAVVINTSAGISLGAKELNWDELIKPNTFKKLYGPYVSSKEALNVVTAALGRELAGEEIIVRNADPGPNKTQLTKGPGTPLWMRLFYGLLPSPDKGARKILEVGISPKWAEKTGVFISGGKIAALPPVLRAETFQDDLLRKCRQRAGEP